MKLLLVGVLLVIAACQAQFLVLYRQNITCDEPSTLGTLEVGVCYNGNFSGAGLNFGSIWSTWGSAVMGYDYFFCRRYGTQAVAIWSVDYSNPGTCRKPPKSESWLYSGVPV